MHIHNHLFSISFSAILALFLLPQQANAALVLDGLVDYFDADTGVTTGGSGQIVGWANSASGNDITSADNETALVSGPNGQAMIRFSNTSSGGGLIYQSSGSLSFGFALVVAARLNDTIDSMVNAFPRFHRGANDSHSLFIRQSNDTLELKANPLGTSDRPQSAFQSPLGPIDIGDVAIIAALLTPTSQELYINGVLQDSSAVSIASYTIDSNFEIGNSLIGDIGTVLVYNGTLSNAGLQETTYQLMTDYGLRSAVPIPSSWVLLVGSFPALIAALRRGEKRQAERGEKGAKRCGAQLSVA